MSHVLARLLEVNEVIFASIIKDLERGSGQDGIDIRLSAEINNIVLRKHRELGLDPVNSTAKEVYYALYNLVLLHDRFLARRLGISNEANPKQIFPVLEKSINKLDIPKSVWALKHSALRRLLAATPPKRVMRALGYRSLDSMLKRESPGLVLAAIPYLETALWQRMFAKKYHKLQPTDFEHRPVNVTYINTKRWQKLSTEIVKSSRHNLITLYELGEILILPIDQKSMPGLTLTSYCLILKAIIDVRMFSAYLRLMQIQPDFGRTLINELKSTAQTKYNLSGLEVPWHMVAKHYGRQGFVPDSFEPHIFYEDIVWQPVEKVLYQLEPALHFWYELDFVGLKKADQLVSFNLIDIALSVINQRQFGYHIVDYFKESLWHELIVGYLQQPAMATQILGQINLTNNDIDEFNLLQELMI